MNKLFSIFMATLFALAPMLANAQPAPPDYVKYCYTVVFPIPHTRCEYRYRYYTPVPPRYTPAPRHHHPAPPPPPRGGHPGPNYVPHHGPRR